MGYCMKPIIKKFNRLRIRVRSQLDKQISHNTRIDVDGLLFHHVWTTIDGRLVSPISLGIKKNKQ